MPHLAVARFWFEGNRYSPRPTTLADFQRREWHAGPAALDAARRTATELAAVAAFAEAHPDWQLTVLRCCSANPGGPIEAPVFARIVEEIAAGLRGGQFDAVYLSLHGAAVVDGQAAPERALVQAVRDAAGRRVPVAASFDLHANAPPVELLDFSSAYRTYPHVDMRQTAERVLAFLAQRVQGLPRPAAAACRLDLLLPSFNMRTGDSDGAAKTAATAGADAGAKSANRGAPMAEVAGAGRRARSAAVARNQRLRRLSACERLRAARRSPTPGGRGRPRMHFISIRCLPLLRPGPVPPEAGGNFQFSLASPFADLYMNRRAFGIPVERR